MKQYPVAPHSYFTVVNKADQKRLFLEGTVDEPLFGYSDDFTISEVEARLAASQNETTKRSLMFVLIAAKLQLTTQQSEIVEDFRYMNKMIYGVPKKDVVAAILGRASQKVADDTQYLWQYIADHVPIHAELHAVAPSEVTFEHYKSMFTAYLRLPKTENGSLVKEISSMLQITKLDTKGWKIIESNDESHARVNHAHRTIRIGRGYSPRTKGAARRIAVHEVYGHALRGPQLTIAESEGFAVTLEQLLSPSFTFRRSYRYLAAALGWGIDGKPRTFRQVYEIIWRLMMIMSKYSEDTAKSHAFDECVRVYRGGRSDIAGCVYLKDTVYFDANIAVWSELSKKKLEYNEFIDIIEGRRKVLL